MPPNPYRSRPGLRAARGTRHMRQWWERRSLRLRLTLWYAITSTIILLALGGMLLFVVHGRLVSQMDRQLRGDFEMVESRVARDSAGNLRWLGYGHDKDELEWEKQAGPWFEILSPGGSILLREGPSSNWKTIPTLTHRQNAVAPFSAEMQRHLHVRVLENSTRIAGERVVLRVFRSEAELRRAMAELGAVLAFGLPLELLSPLTALRAVGEAALRPDAGDPKSLREALSSMLEETRRLSDLVDALLLLARADTSGVSPSLDQVDLTGLVNEVRETLLVLAEEKNQQIEIIAEQLTIRADRELLRLALLNLIHNAIRYSAEGLMISLRVRRRDANSVVEVVDQGPGIAPEHQQKIFERFYRVDKARSRASGGAGLGLAIARWAIERQQGHIELESEPGRGSLF